MAPKKRPTKPSAAKPSAKKPATKKPAAKTPTAKKPATKKKHVGGAIRNLDEVDFSNYNSDSADKTQAALYDAFQARKVAAEERRQNDAHRRGLIQLGRPAPLMPIYPESAKQAFDDWIARHYPHAVAARGEPTASNNFTKAFVDKYGVQEKAKLDELQSMLGF